MSSPARVFSSAGVPAAITVPWSMMTMSEASRSASSRYWVVSRMSVPVTTRLRIASGCRLVEQEQAGGSGQDDAQVDAAAHAAGIGAHQPVGVGGQLHLVENPDRLRLGRLLAEPEKTTDHLQVLPAGHR